MLNPPSNGQLLYLLHIPISAHQPVVNPPVSSPPVASTSVILLANQAQATPPADATQISGDNGEEMLSGSNQAAPGNAHPCLLFAGEGTKG